MKILFLGDVMGRPGREAMKRDLPGLRKKHGLDLVIANAENASGGLGLTAKTATELFSLGADLLSSGNHIWKHKEIYQYLRREPRLIRPGNYPEGAPGSGLIVYENGRGPAVALMNLLGRTYLDSVDCPFRKADELLEQVPDQVRVRVVDFHAEATSEKKALAYYLEGRVSAVLGTHTHVQTNDARVLPGGTAAVTDVGMCGVQESVLGMDKDIIVARFLDRLPKRFNLAKGNPVLQGALLDVDEATGKARGVELI